MADPAVDTASLEAAKTAANELLGILQKIGSAASEAASNVKSAAAAQRRYFSFHGAKGE